jgi:hypothetical protein
MMMFNQALAIAVCVVCVGCSSANVNPPAPRARTGYVDFYTDSPFGLSWQVKREQDDTGPMRTVFSDYKPLEGNILRLAAPPGSYRFQVWFMNEVTQGPQVVSVKVVAGEVTPVHVTLTPSGSASVQTKSYEYRPTVRATRPVAQYGTALNEAYRIGAVPAAPRPYQPKQQMPYFSAKSNDRD